MGTIHVVPEVETFHSLGGDGSADDAGCVIQFSGIRGFNVDVVATACKNQISLLQDYCNDPKLSDRQALANSADLDQTAPRGAV